MVLFVQLAPRQAAHFLLRGEVEYARHPVDDRAEVRLHLLDGVFVPVLRQVLLGVAAAHPVEGRGQVVLTFRAAGHIVAPLHHLAVVRVRELLLRRGDERTGVHSIQDLLGVQRQAGDVDGPEPVLDLPFSALAHIDKERRSKNLRLKVLVHGREIPRPSGLVDPSKLLREESPQGGDALLSVEHLVATLGGLGEVDQAERVSAQDGPNYVHLPLAAVLGV